MLGAGVGKGGGMDIVIVPVEGANIVLIDRFFLFINNLRNFLL